MNSVSFKGVMGALGLTCLGLLALFINSRLPIWDFSGPGPGLMPTIGASLMIVAALLSIGGLRRDPEAQPGAPSRASLIYVVSFGLLLPLTAIVGLLPALGLLAAGLLYFAERQSLRLSLSLPVAAAAASWLLFEHLLLVPLPHGLVWTS
jgi:putative tricarboxylic transport membrane protein